MFVEPADRDAGLLHHIGNADAFQTEFAKSLGSDADDPSMRLCLVALRITHLPSPSLPESAWIAPDRKRLLEYRCTLHRLDANIPLLVQEPHSVNNKRLMESLNK